MLCRPKRFLLLTIALFLGCNGTNNVKESMDFFGKKKGQEKEEVKNTTSGPPPLISKIHHTTIHADGDSTVNLPGAGTESKGDELKLTPDLLKALALLRVQTSSDRSSEAEYSAQVEWHKKVSIFSTVGLFIMAIACVIFMFAVKRFRNELEKFGIPARGVGKALRSLVGKKKHLSYIVDNSKDHIENIISEIDNKIANNGLSDETKGVLNWQKGTLYRVLRGYDKRKEDDGYEET